MADDQVPRPDVLLIYPPLGNLTDPGIHQHTGAGSVPEVVVEHEINMQDGSWSPFSSADVVAGAQATSPMARLAKDIAERAIGKVPPRIVGFSVVFPSRVIPAFQMAQRIRRLHPETHITMGGPFITLHFKRLRTPQIFSVVHSLVFEEGEQPLEALEATGIRKVRFSDESADPRVLEFVCEQLKEDGLAIRWTAHTRIDRRLTRARCTLFREGGCERLNVGIESWNDRILGLMRKGITTSLIEEVLTDIKGTVPLGAYLMAGFPTETVEEFRASHERVMECEKMGLLAGHFYGWFAVLSESHIWDHPEAYGIPPLESPAEQDLLPHVFLSRDGETTELRRCYMEMKLAERRRLLPIGEIPLPGAGKQREALRFDLSRISEASLQVDDLEVETHAEWVGRGDRLVTPLEAMRRDLQE